MLDVHYGQEFTIVLFRSLVWQFDGITYIVEPFSFGISKGGIGKESHTRLMTHAASYGRSTFGNVSELFRSGALIHRGVGHENGVRLSYKNVDEIGRAHV